MPAIIYVPRIFGGTIILTVTPPPPPPASPIPTLLQPVQFRDGEQPVQFRDGEVKTGGR